MNTLVDLEKPPFFTALYLTPENGADEGLHSEAISVMLSLSMILSGFLGFRDDQAAENRRIRNRDKLRHLKLAHSFCIV